MIASSRSSLLTSRVSNRNPHSRLVFLVKSAYIFAAGSALARNPTSLGGGSSFDTCSLISSINVLAIVAARTTPSKLAHFFATEAERHEGGVSALIGFR